MHQYELTPQQPERPKHNTNRGRSLWRGLASGMMIFVLCLAFGIGLTLIGYSLIVGDLPSPGDLQQRTSSFQSTRIYDREGNLLNETFDPNTGRRTVVPLSQMSPYLQQATIATEDANFYRHQGVDPVALARALYYAVQEGDIVSGASTIPQQLVKMTMLSPERSIRRKINEAILSAEISRRYSKEQILETYLNELFYGNLAYGADAAAETYFTKDVAELSLAEAALLAGLPQLPAYYDPYTHPDRAKERQGIVLGLMVENGMITASEADSAWNEPLSYAPLEFNLIAPHFTLFVRQQLESILGPEALYQSGLNVVTTLDPDLQDEAQRIVHDQVAKLAGHNASNGALVAIRPETGEVLALVGSADFENVEIDGQINMALAPRQPGSAIKPFVYLANFQQPEKPASERWTPGTLVADIKEAFPDGANLPYVPVNYDGKEHGLVTVRTALGSSYNIPAVRALEAVGLPSFLELMQRLGVTTLTRPDYGLSLSLGGGEMPLMELTGAYATLASGGRRIPPATIAEISDGSGTVLCKLGTERPCLPTSPQEMVIDPVDAFLISDILSDNEARLPAFGPNSVLRLPRPAAVKTGTTNDFRDNLTVGYTPQLVTGVWVGNADNSPMRDISGVSGAGPIWNQFMQFALSDEPAIGFTPPPGVERVEVCADTGSKPSDACPQKTEHFFSAEAPPLPSQKDLYQTIRLDKTSGKLATEFTPSGAIEEKIFKVYPSEHRTWAEEHGIPQPPADDSEAFQFAPNVLIRQPIEGEVVSDVLTVIGSADLSAFQSYELQYGISHDPGAFSLPFSGPHGDAIIDGTLGHWDVRGLHDGPHTLRLIARDTFGSEYESRVRVFVQNPTPTVLIPATATWTPVPPTSTATRAPTSTSAPTATPQAPDTPTVTPVPPTPTAQPTAVPTQSPTEAPTEGPTSTPVLTATWTPLPTETLVPTSTWTPPPPQATPTWTPLPPQTPITDTENISDIGAGVLPDDEAPDDQN